ncbi:deoxyuridine 5'-triphosphate nucleotidohydrolase [Achromatium sp. WMS2]|nr:deoxyuridine 5'-triphosphate nucleotidohydrolase [Achromatium sp. WMS2]
MHSLQTRILDHRIGSVYPLPAYATSGSAGLDLRAMLNEPLMLFPDQTELISTGISIYIGDPGLTAILLPRSGLGHSRGIVLGNLVGLIDSDYQGPLLISCWNRGTDTVRIDIGDRIAQLVLVPVIKVNLEIVDNFTASPRGSSGFGHSGCV